MPPSRIDFATYNESLGRSHQPAIDTALGMIRTAAVSFEHLTNNQEWDRFVSIIQNKYEIAKKERDESLAMLGEAWKEEDIRYHSKNYNFFKGVTVALEEMIHLPHQVMDQYRELKK